MFEAMTDGRFWAPVTDKAREFADGDDDRLAAVAFARWLSECGIEFHWYPDSLRFDMGAYQDVEAKASRLIEPAIVRLTPEASYTFAVQFFGSFEPIACIAGLTYRSRWAELIERHNDRVPVGQLLSAADWLRSFPHHHTPCAEVALAKSQAAAAA